MPADPRAWCDEAPRPAGMVPLTVAAPNTTGAATSGPLVVKQASVTAVLCDLAAAAFAGMCVAPWVTIIDRSIMWDAMGTHRTREGFRIGFQQLLARPFSAEWLFRKKEFALVFAVYSLTYLTSNWIKTFFTAFRQQPMSAYRTPEFIGTNVVNQYMGIRHKDHNFVRMFCPPDKMAAKLKQSIPKTAYALWVVRDSLSVFASFAMVEPLSMAVSQQYGWRFETTRYALQFACPMAIQVLSTPCHVWGIDQANNPQHTTAQRLALLREKFPAACASRMGRICAAFGVGGNANTFAREALHLRFGTGIKVPSTPK